MTSLLYSVATIAIGLRTENADALLHHGGGARIDGVSSSQRRCGENVAAAVVQLSW